LIFLLALLVAIPMSTAQGAENPDDGNWHFTLTPYAWVPSVDGTLSFTPPRSGDGSPSPGAEGSPSVELSATEVREKLDFAFMAAADVRKGNWLLFTDFIYLNLSGDAAVGSIIGPSGIVEIPINIDTELDQKGFSWTFAVGYALLRSPSISLDLLLGFRDNQLKATLDWQFAEPPQLLPQSGSLSQTTVLWAVLIGVKGRIGLGATGNWYIPYYVDIGTGSSIFTWQALIGLGYRFRRVELHLSYRHLYYNTDFARLLDNVSFGGPALGLSFRF
jgi:hypothetical protein